MTRRALIRHKRTAVVVGLGLFVLACVILYQAWGRGDTPLIFRPFVPF